MGTNTHLHRIPIVPGDADVVPRLIDALHDSSLVVRRAAAQDLGRYGDQRALEPLIAMLEDPYDSLQETAGWALAELGYRRAIGPLLKALNGPNQNARRGAAIALGRLHAAEAVPILISTLQTDPNDRRLCSNAATSLGLLGDRRAVEPLIQLLQRVTKSRYSWVTDDAIAALGKLADPRAIAPLTLLLKRGNSEAGEALRMIGAGPVLEQLAIQLQHRNPEIRRTALVALEALGDPAALDLIMPCLGDVAAGVRRSGVVALDQLNDRRAVGPLIEALDDPDRHVRVLAARALGHLGDPLAIPALIKALRQHTGAAGGALARLGIAAVEPLRELLRENDPQVRREARRALKRLGALDSLD